MSTESLKVFFNALISQVQSVTVHALKVVLAWWGGINKDRGSPRSARSQSGQVYGVGGSGLDKMEAFLQKRIGRYPSLIWAGVGVLMMGRLGGGGSYRMGSVQVYLGRKGSRAGSGRS